MAEDQQLKTGKTSNPFTATLVPVADSKPLGTPVGKDFAGDFARLKLTVIRPVFETVGNTLKERGHEFNISEEPGGKISIHIVPAGVSKSGRPYTWFPTLSFFGAPFTKTVGLHGINARRNSEGGSGQRGDYKLAQVNREIVEKELMKFVGEIANWK